LNSPLIRPIKKSLSGGVRFFSFYSHRYEGRITAIKTKIKEENLKMKTVKKLVFGFVIGVLGVVAATAQQSQVNGKLFKAVPALKRAAAKSGIGAEYLNSYFLGYDLEAAKEHIRKKETREALAQLAFLWDELYLQPEASQVEAVLRAVVRGQGTIDMAIAKLDSVATSLDTRLKPDHKWYYNVGKTYSQVSITANNEDYKTFSMKLAELGKLAKTSPAGTPVDLITAMAKIGEIATKSDITDNDVAILKAQFETIDNVIGA
jgi:hypothetical protein